MLDLGRSTVKNIIDIFNDCIPDGGKCSCKYVDGLSIEEYLEMKRGVIDE